MSCGCGKPPIERQQASQEGSSMAQLRRTARSKAVPGVGYARRGVIHTVPDNLVADLLATGEWERVGEPVTERVTEPAPATPAAKTTTKPKARARKK